MLFLSGNLILEGPKMAKNNIVFINELSLNFFLINLFKIEKYKIFEPLKYK
jgi:hypothetical protein